MMDSWLYDENQPFLHLIALDRFNKLKKQLDNGYFEGLVQKYLLDNPHRAVLVLKPVPGLEAKETEELQKKLDAYKSNLPQKNSRQL